MPETGTSGSVGAPGGNLRGHPADWDSPQWPRAESPIHRSMAMGRAFSPRLLLSTRSPGALPQAGIWTRRWRYDVQHIATHSVNPQRTPGTCARYLRSYL